ncbi:PadR family transcriptional regulator [Agromyces larvae]|uniref:PadR family transcriptional regulator n=1 Tax=Agromyces larvae TaxID=2929802 RepID=UPI00338FFC7F
MAILEAGLRLQGDAGSFYGFALARELSQADNGSLTAHGTLYKALGRMTEGGLLSAQWEDPAIAEAEGRPRRKLYRVTGQGELALSAEIRRLVLARAWQGQGLRTT